nr:ATP-dependent DNA helicase PIF1-like [Tanacetum cinerariifolium]
MNINGNDDGEDLYNSDMFSEEDDKDSFINDGSTDYATTGDEDSNEFFRKKECKNIKKTYESSDSVSIVDVDTNFNKSLYIDDFLNSIRVVGLPQHTLKLKIRAPVMYMRNIDQRAGQCNGTRLQILRMRINIIEAKIISGGNIGSICAIPRMFWVTVLIKKANDMVKLQALVDGKRVVVTEDVIRSDLRLDDADGVECLPNEEIFIELARMGYEKPPPKLMFYKAFFFAQWKFLIHNVVQCRKFNFSKYIFDSMVRNVDSPTKFLMYLRFLQAIINAQVDDLSSHTNQYTSPALIQKVFANMRRVGKGFSGVETPLFATMLASKIIKLKKRITKLEKKRRLKSSSLKRLRKVGERIEAIDADEDITLVDAKTQVYLEVELQGRKDDDNAAIKDASVAEPTVFDDEEVTMTMAQTLSRSREKQEKDNLEKAKVLQKQYEDKQENIDWNTFEEKMQEKHLDNIKKYQSLKRKPIPIAQARKNMIVYLKNMAGYKMKHFKGMTYDKANDMVKLQALVDGKRVVVTEDVIRSDLRLDDADGVECLPNEEIFIELARMGYEKPPPKLMFYKAFFFAQWKFLIHNVVQCRKFNFSKYIFDSMVRNVDSPTKFLMYLRFLQAIINAQVDDLSSHTNQYTSPALIQKVFANMRRVGKGFSGVETPLFATMLVEPQDAKNEDDVEIPAAPTPPPPTIKPSPPPQEPITTPP